MDANKKAESWQDKAEVKLRDLKATATEWAD